MKELSHLENTELFELKQCPDCHTPGFLSSPAGGASSPIRCTNCGSQFSVVPPRFAERVLEGPSLEPYTLIGRLKSRKSVYQHRQFGVAVEKNVILFVAPTTEEQAEIYELFPDLKPKP